MGCGAIGCELLKDFALLGLSTGEQGMVSTKWPNILLTLNCSSQRIHLLSKLRGNNKKNFYQ